MIRLSCFREQMMRHHTPTVHGGSCLGPTIRSATMWLVCFAVLASYAQSPVLTSRAAPSLDPPLETVSKQVQEVSLILTVTDDHGHLVRNLTSSDLTILDNDVSPERITHFENQTDLPLRVALVIDTSSSVTYCFRSEQNAASAFLKHILRPTTDLALVIGFNQETHVAQAATNENSLLSQGLRGLHAGGETAIYDAVSAATHELMDIRGTGPARRAIILITDGEDNHSQMSLQQAAEMAQQNETVVYVLSTNLMPGNRLDEHDRAMKQLAETTGGNLLRAGCEEDARSSFSRLEKELRSQYAVGYKPANTSPDGSFHHLIVLGPKKFRIYHRQGYFAR